MLTTFKHRGKVRTLDIVMFSPPKISSAISGVKYICLHVFTVFFPTQPFNGEPTLLVHCLF